MIGDIELSPASSILIGDGPVATRLRRVDWASSPLGEPARWPASLKTLVGVMLGSDQPMLIGWGPDLIALYNDAHARLIGDRDEATLGRPLFEAWPEVRETIEPLFREALAGRASHLSDVVVAVRRSGRTIPAHFAISYTPVRDAGGIVGVLCLSNETTEVIAAEWRKAALVELADRLRPLDDPSKVVSAALDVLGRALRANRVSFTEFYDNDWLEVQTGYVDGVPSFEGRFPISRFDRDNCDRLRAGHSIFHDDVAVTDPRNAEIWTAIQARSFAATPLVRDGDLRAALQVSFREPHAWTSHEGGLIDDFAQRLWDSLERVRAERALRLSEARFRAAVAAIQGVLWTNNAAGEMTGDQAGWSALTGQSAAECQGYGWADAVHPDDALATIEAWRHAVAERRPFLFEHRVRCHDGVWRSFAIRAIPILDDDGEIREWVGVHTDLTDQRSAEASLRDLNAALRDRIAEEQKLVEELVTRSTALKNAQETLQTIFNGSSEGLTLCRLIRDDDGRVLDYQVLDVNPAHSVLTGATRQQMLAKPVSQIAPPVNPLWFKSAEDAVNSGLPQTFEVRSPATGRWLEIHVSPVSGDLFAQTFIDVTARHSIEEQRARLVAEMNHRVKNNFQMVASMLELQARRADPEVSAQLKTAVQRVHLMASLHETLALAPEVGEVDVQAYLDVICQRLRLSIDEPERIRLILTSEPATLDADRAMLLGFVVNELVTNAIKYAFPAPASGGISVTFASDDETYVLRIADGGAGLPESASPKGTGLGMKLVDAFVKQIGGVLQIRRAPGVEYVIRFKAAAGARAA